MASYSARHIEDNLIPFPPQYKWSSISADNFKDALYSNIVKQKIKDFENLAQSSSVDLMVSKLNDIIVTAADISLQKKSKTKAKRRLSKNGLIQSYTKCAECLIKKAICMLNFQMIHMFAAPFINLENYTLKLAHVNENHINLTLLINWNIYMKLTQKAYWKLLEDLKGDESPNTETHITADDWVDHFSNLNTINETFTARVQEISNLLAQENMKEFCEIDFKITTKELYDAVFSLKDNKAVGIKRNAEMQF